MKKILIGLLILGICLFAGVSSSALWVEDIPGVFEFTEVTTSATATAGTVRLFATGDTVYIVDESANKSALARLTGDEIVSGTWTFSTEPAFTGGIQLNDDDNLTLGTDDDFTVTFDADSLNIVPNTDDTGLVEIGSGTKGIDVKIFLSDANHFVHFDQDADIVYGGGDAKGVAAYFYGATANHRVFWDETNDTWYFGQDNHGLPVYFYGESADKLAWWDEANDQWLFGKTNYGVDVKHWGDTDGAYALFDQDQDELVFEQYDIHMGDTDLIYLGDDKDFSVTADADSLNIVPNTDDTGTLEIGSSTKAFDWKSFGTGSEYLLFDASAHELQTSGIDIDIADNDYINFGTDNDFTAQYDGTDISILPNTDDTGSIIFGSATLGYDVNWYGVTATAIVSLDAGDDQVKFTDASMLFGEDDAINFYDTAVNIQAADDGHLDLTADVSIDLNGDVICTGHVDGVVFTVNAFQYPVSATEWAPNIDGARCPDAQAAVVVYLPLNFLKIGDEIVSYTLVGDVVEASTATVDAQIYRINKADPLTTTAITGGAMTQITADGNFDVLTTLSAVETVATDKQYVIQITGTTTASDAITVMGAEVAINRKL